MTDDFSVELILTDSLKKLFPTLITPVDQAINNGHWPQEIWEQIEQLGILNVLTDSPESWPLACAVGSTLGQYPLNLPIVETLIARGLDEAMREINAPVTLQVGSTLPWGRYCKHALMISDNQLVRARLEAPTTSGYNLAEEPRDRCCAASTTTITRDDAVVEIQLAHALLRVAQCAGAMQGALDLCIQYVCERKQFSRPLAQFQAIQQQLAAMAGAVATVDVAARHAAKKAAALGIIQAQGAIQCACSQALAAVQPVTSIAHQVHGAMGFTLEYPLQRYTRRLWSWHGELNRIPWAEQLGESVLEKGGAHLWSQIVNT